MEELNQSNSSDLLSPLNQKLIEDNILKNPTKIGNLVLKYISNDLKNCSWEKEGFEVISINKRIKKINNFNKILFQILNYKKLSFNKKDKRVLKCLLKSEMNKNTRKKVQKIL